MDLPTKNFSPKSILCLPCEFCGAPARSKCSRCSAAFYCSVEHQRQDWPVHEKVCKKPQPSKPVSMNPCTISDEAFINFPPGTSTDTFLGGIPPSSSQEMFVNAVEAPTDAFINMSLSTVADESFAPSLSLENWCQNTIPCSNSEGINPVVLPSTLANVVNPDSSSIIPQNIVLPPEEDIFSSLSNEYLTEDTNFWNLINACAQDTVNYGTLLEGNTLSQMTNPQADASFPPDENLESTVGPDPGSKLHRLSIDKISEIIVRDMNNVGICVLDNFVGTNFGDLVFQEVKSMYDKGVFRKGELVEPNVCNENIRSDVTTWVNGNEPYCKYIGSLMKKLDLIIATCNKLPNNGIFSKYKLHKRTKAMVACYPGLGTHYKKHIDNPNQDGRCITCIYYLNKNWDSKKHGGMLRMFPAANETQIANIEPFFDRVIFFWSDKRNPHEVLPAFTIRFAITLWYFDADERERALNKLAAKNRALMKSRKK